MGLSSSIILATDVKEKIVRQAQVMRELALLSYEEFVNQIDELNKITKTIPDSNGKILVFFIKKGTDSTILWKSAVRIACVRVEGESGNLDSYRLLNLRQFMKAYNSLASYASVKSSSLSSSSLPKELSTSMIFNGLDSCLMADSDLECCICMERKPEISLPCTHSYCLLCIEQWNVSHKTCPVCREQVENTTDSWVISEAPGLEEVEAELKKAMTNLTQDQET